MSLKQRFGDGVPISNPPEALYEIRQQFPRFFVLKSIAFSE